MHGYYTTASREKQAIFRKIFNESAFFSVGILAVFFNFPEFHDIWADIGANSGTVRDLFMYILLFIN